MSSLSSARSNRTHVWVRIDLAEAMLENNGHVPDDWKPSDGRIRARSSNKFDWVWARGYLVEQHTNGEATTNIKNGASPFGQVKLRKVKNSPISSPSSLSSSSPASPTRAKRRTGQVTVVVHDAEFAPYYLQEKSFTFDPDLLSDNQEEVLCMANSWWQTKESSAHPPDDLTSLVHLHEPAVVYCLKKRYASDTIYTYTGKILLALNPFRVCKHLYGETVMQRYWQQDNTRERPPPHIYAVAQDAYGSMLRAMEVRGDDERTNQSILVSGESGAGKTETTKIIMRYLAAMSRRHVGSDPKHRTVDGDGVGIESQVLQSNPILESFGNARTVRNDNSSRFGKFIEIEFLPSGCLVSASIETYLLEKVRLISQAPGERNFHIFYELLSGLPQKERRDLDIGNKTAKDFRITSVSGTYDRRDGVDDRDTYRELRQALMTVGFSPSEQRDLFRVACALLHASNLEFVETAADSSQLDDSNQSLAPTLELLGVSHDALENALCLCAIEARGETLYKNLSVTKATKALEALIKATYGALFAHIVRRVNSSITVQHIVNGAKEEYNHAGKGSINCLDIFGFESFKVNSFEQLCINYCNEALQQQFNRFVFKLEQEEYERQGIEWSFISFPDNQDILDLVEEKAGGLIAILDEKCRIPRSSDMMFARAAYEKCGEHPRFVASNAQRAQGTFSVRHYAGEVEYDTTNFLEKNRDELSREATDLLASSDIAFVASLGAMLKEMPSTHLRSPSPAISDASSGASGTGLPNRRMLRRTSSSIMRETVGSQFAQQLKELRFRIDETTPHYVRCLKPNDDLVPDSFNPVVIADQLRCAGVLEAIRVSRVGFPHRYSHDDFVARYHMLASDTMTRFSKIRKGRDLCDLLVKAVAMQVSETQHLFERDAPKASERPSQPFSESVHIGIQLGRTKVFLRRQAFETIEYLRRERSESAATRLQASTRGFLARVHLLRCIEASIRLQCLARRTQATQLVTSLRQDRSAMKIQCAWRRFVAERYFWAALAIAEWCQRTRRGIVAREICAFLLLDYKATCIQKTWRRYAATWRFYCIVRGIVLVQALYRAQAAKEEYRQRKREANDLRKVAEERDKYRREALRLQRELEKNRESVEVERLRREVELLQLQLRKAQFSNGSQAVDRESADEDSPAEGHSRPIRPVSESPSKPRLPTSVSVTRESPDKTVSSLGTTPDRRSVGSRNASPRRSPSLHRAANKSDIFRAHDRAPQDRSRLSSVRSVGSTSLLDAEDELHQMHSISEVQVSPKTPGTPRSLLDTASPGTESDGSSYLDDASLLRKAIYEGNENDFQLILERSQFSDVLINDCDQEGNCPIHVAVLSSNDSIAKYLLEHGAAVNVQNYKGVTPLHLATTPSMIRILLEVGKANPNIPDTDGICALHMAVQRLDALSVHRILDHRADVNAADHTLWYTPLHMIAQPYDIDDTISDDGLQDVGEIPVRGQIAKMLCEAEDPSPPDIDFKDKEGNTPLHHAAMLTTKDAGEVLSCFLEHGADPNIANDRVQTPLHLLCHNEPLRKYHAFQEMLHDLLFHGADPNQPSTTGCTALHLSLYHRDIDSAIQLIHNGAELHLIWRKPKRWNSFWDEMNTSEILPLDMVQDEHSLHRLLAAIAKPPKWAPSRPWCMHCKAVLGSFARALHCRHCGRLICGACAPRSLNAEFFPKSFEIYESSWVCTVCEKILVSRKEESGSGATLPTASWSKDEEDDRDSF